jgi:site-specific recombinase XerD
MAEVWYATTATLTPSTRLAYRSLLDQHVLPRWGSAELRSVTTSAVATWVADLAATRSSSTTRHAVSVLRQILALAVADRRIAVNPVGAVALPRLPTREERFLTAAQLDRLVNEMETPRDRSLVLLLGWVGLRFGEAVALRRADVDLLPRADRAGGLRGSRHHSAWLDQDPPGSNRCSAFVRLR